MLVTDDAGEPDVTAFILTGVSSQSPTVLIGDEVIRTSDLTGRSLPRFNAAAIEGQAMLAINAHVMRRRRELVVFHAGAVALGDRAAIIIGRTESGKSTTTLSLLLSQSDARPLSDELALVNVARREVEAFPRLLSIRQGARRLLGLNALLLDWDAFEPVGVLSPSWADRAIPGAFFFIEGRAKRASVREMNLSESIFACMPSVLCGLTESNRMSVMDDVIRALGTAPAYSITLGSPEENVRIIRELTCAVAAIPA